MSLWGGDTIQTMPVPLADPALVALGTTLLVKRVPEPLTEGGVMRVLLGDAAPNRSHDLFPFFPKFGIIFSL